MFPCSVVLDGEYGQTGLSMGVPVVLGRSGVREIKMWELEGDESAAFEPQCRGDGCRRPHRR